MSSGCLAIITPNCISKATKAIHLFKGYNLSADALIKKYKLKNIIAAYEGCSILVHSLWTDVQFLQDLVSLSIFRKIRVDIALLLSTSQEIYFFLIF